MKSALEAVFGAGTAPTSSNVAAAKALLEALGYTVEKGGRIAPTAPGGRRPPPLPPTPGTRPPPAPSPQQPPAPPQTRFSTRTPELGRPPARGEEDPFGPEIHLTPQSSNVYSFSYYRRAGEATGTLFVRFKAQRLNADSVSHGTGRLGGRRQLHGSLGSTVAGGDRPNLPGVLYAYYRVPPGVYLRMQTASSKGKFVWDNLRVRGTIYGHKYAYAAVQGQVTTDALTPGIRGTYIPRRATKSGFKTRSIADVGTGRRGFQSSTLPSQIGFSTRRR